MATAKEKTRDELAAIRDTVESIWVAIVLAFVLRAFMIEAFVIPTGSMAPRLMGEHWDLTCPACGRQYAFGLRRENPGQERAFHDKPHPPAGACCPNCGYNRPPADYVNGGDRVLVLKYLYRFREPQPWDVVVFRNPQNNRENYIKRLIGLPGETIEIVHGDIFVKTSAGASWKIRRKPPRAQKAMWQIVFHNDYRPSPELVDPNSIPHWREVPTQKSWKTTNNGRRFDFTGGEEPTTLEFQADKDYFLPRYGYNSRSFETGPIDKDVDLCSDLKLSFVFIPRSDDAAVSLLLTNYEHRFRADVRRDGTIVLSHKADGDARGGWEEWGRKKLRPFKKGRGYQVALSHVDFRVAVRVNGEVVLATTDEKYDADYHALRARAIILWSLTETEQRLGQVESALRGLAQSGTDSTEQRRQEDHLKAELARLRALKAEQQTNMRRWIPYPVPRVRISAWGGPCQLRHLALYRDVYYTASSLEKLPPGPLGKYAADIKDSPELEGRNKWMVRPDGKHAGWAVAPNRLTLRRHPEKPDLDEFFVLGDNSPQSLDGRAWVKAAPSLKLYDEDGKSQYQLGTVPRYNMIGKAFFVYWPAGFRLPGLSSLSVIPNVGKMRLIR